MRLAVWFALAAGLWAALHLLLRSERRTAVIAHRGAAGEAPENTLAGIERGMESGARYLEVDVQRGRDGALVVIHDLRVERTTDGSGAVADQTLEELDALDAGGWFGREFTGEGVPTLDQVLAATEGWPGVLVVEAKSPGRYPGIAEDLAAALAARPDARLEVVSFDHGWLRRFRNRSPEIDLGALSVYPRRLPGPEEAERIGVFWLATILDPTLLGRAHRRGLEVWVWTVDRPWLQDLLAWLGVDGITTNEPTSTVKRWRGIPQTPEGNSPQG